MATPPLLDLDELLRPISDDRPSGESLTYEPEYDEIREARRSEDDTLQGDWERKVKVADWERVIELGSRCLRQKTKDLQIAAWMVEALARRHAFAGLRDGFRLIVGLLDQFWDTLYPELEDDDLEARAGPFVFLNDPKILPALIRNIPLTDGFNEARYSHFRYQESRATLNAGKKDQERMEAMIAEGKITAEQFDDAVAQTPWRFYRELADDLAGCIDAFKACDTTNDARFGRDAPSLTGVRKALDDCRTLVDSILKKKQDQAGAASDEPEPDAEAEAEESGEAEADEGRWASEESADEPEPAAARRPSGRRRRSGGGPIGSADDAYDRIVDAAAYLRQNEPGSPSAYLVVRALRLGELYGLGMPPDPAALVGPPREARQSLKALAASENWPELLEQAEQTLGGPEGRAWLDSQRLALAAMVGAGLEAPAAAVRGLLRAVLADFPDLPRAELDDGTPTANAETLAWLESEILAKPRDAAAEPAEYVPPAYEPEPEPARGSVDGVEVESEPDAWDLALDEVKSGRAADAIQRLRRAVNAAPTGREKFRRKLQLAELCLLARQPRVALPLLDELARQVDEFRLEQWEDEALCARVWATLYRCLRDSGAADNGAAERLRQAYTRLCRLDIHQALLYGEDGPG